MDATVLATALPTIAADIGTTPVALKLALTAYFVAMAIFIPISAWLGDRLGVKNVLRAAIVVFMVGSLGCAFAGSLHEFVLARFVQGMGGAMMSPLARLMLYRITPRDGLVRAMAWLTVPAVVAPMVGPPVGGLLATFFSWHWIFLINLPVGIAGLLAITSVIPDIEPAPGRPLDFVGFLLLALTFSGCVFGFSLFSMPALPRWLAVATAAVGLAAGSLYIAHARRSARPLIDLRLISEPGFRASVIGGLIFLMSAGAVPFLLPPMLQMGFGLTPLQSGLITFIGAVGSLLTKFFAPHMFAAIGFRTAMIWSALLTALALMLNGTFTPETPVFVIMATLMFAGLARSAFLTGRHVLALADVRPEDAGQATAIDTVVRPIGTALGVALAGGVLEFSALANGRPVTMDDFHLAFFLLASICTLTTIPFLRLSKGAGSMVSGHRKHQAGQ